MHRAATVPGASLLLKELWPNGSVKERIRAAARDLRWTFTRTEDLWRGEAKIIRGEETVRLHELRLAKEKARQARANEIEEMAHEQRELIQRLARMETMLSTLVSQMADQDASAPGRTPRASRMAVRASGVEMVPGNQP